MVQRKKQEPVIPQRKPIRPIERQKMRPWLYNLLKNERVPGFSWVSKDKETFRISWRHAARQGWDPDVDASLFERWAKHTGKYVEGDEPDPKRWKANFRCALNSLPDVKQLKDQGQRKGQNAYKVYQFLNEKKASKVSKASGECTPVPKVTQTKTKRSLRARNTKRLSYAKMLEMDSEGEEDFTSDLSASECSRSEGEQSPGRLGITEDMVTSDCESRCRLGLQETQLPDFHKICKSTDLTALRNSLPSKEDIAHTKSTDPTNIFNSLLQSQTSVSSRDDESESTTSSAMTEQDVAQLVLDLQDTPEVGDVCYTDFWANGLPVPQEVTVDAIVEEGDTTYFILENVADEVVIQDTPAVRTEHIVSGDVLQYTGLSQL